MERLGPKWVAFCQRYRYFIMLFWLTVSIVGFIWGLKFLDATVSSFPAPKGRYARNLHPQP